MIKALIFDFDGVLVESVDVKTEAFMVLFKGCPKHLKEIQEYHLRNGGISRSEKIQYFYKNILKQSLSDNKLKELCSQFHRLVIDKVVAAPFVMGAEELLQKCLGRYRMYVVSGTPQDELKEVVKLRNLEKYFKGIFGSPAKKEKLVQEIMNRNHFDPSEIVFIGDSITDFNAAKETGVYFAARIADNNLDWSNDPAVLLKCADLTNVNLFLEDLNKKKETVFEKR